MRLLPSRRRSVGALLGRRAIQIAVVVATLLASVAMAAPASAWPMCGW